MEVTSNMMADDVNTNQMIQKIGKLKFQTTLDGGSSFNNNIPERNEELVHTDSSDEFLSEPLRFLHSEGTYRSLNNFLTSSTDSSSTVIPTEPNSFYSCNGEIDPSNIQIPIVGYEIMEERARFTVFKLRIENKGTGDCWYVFRRYTDFVRLCNRLRSSHPDIARYLPRKRWLGNNFDPVFLEERINGLQTLVNSILTNKELLMTQDIQDFFCLNEPPAYSESNEESRAIFEALEETISDLKQQLIEKDKTIDSLQTSLQTTVVETENLKKIIRSSTMNCQKCQKECENLNKMMK